jgi:hypothetical protein
MLTEKVQLRVEEKNKKKTSQNTVLPPTAPLKPQHKRPTGGQYAAAQTFCDIKKGIRSSIKRKEVMNENI